MVWNLLKQKSSRNFSETVTGELQNNVSKLPKELSRIFTVIRKTLADKIDDFVKNFNLKQNLNSMMLMAIKEKIFH